MVPTNYEFQRVAMLRGLLDDARFKRLEAGFEGEEKFYRLLKEFGLKHWVILRNVWFHDDIHFECDFVLVTWHAVYLFEVKNYYGRFVYENGECFSRGVPITYNPVNQARNATIHLRNLTHRFSRNVDVRGALVFIGEHNQVHIQDEIDYIDILQSNDVYQFIQDIILEERRYSSRKLNVDALGDFYVARRVPNPYMSKAFTVEEMKRARKGVFCAKCGQKVKMTRSDYVKCECGLHESREEAIVRTTCEYGILTYNRNFKISDIRTFIDNQASFTYLDNILSKHFTMISDSKVKLFNNVPQKISDFAEHFNFELPKKFIY